MTRKAEAVRPHYQHAVQFYENEKSLFKTVADFIGQGLIDGQPAILIVTEAHRAAILGHIKGRSIDVDQAQRTGDLVVADADTTLALFMADGRPDYGAFEASVGRLIAETLKGRPRHTMIRAYGEMVDVLWQQGKGDAAIRLEMCWNKLATKYGFALLCGYAMGNFYKDATIHDVCRHHTHVVSDTGAVALIY